MVRLLIQFETRSRSLILNRTRVFDNQNNNRY